MQFLPIESFDQYKDCPIAAQRLFLEPVRAKAMHDNRSGWCYGITVTFMRYCNEYHASDAMCDVGGEMQHYEEFLQRQVQKLKTDQRAQDAALMTQTLQNANLEGVGHSRNVWAFRDYNWSSCKMDGNVLRLLGGNGHAVAVDLTMSKEGIGFIFDPNRGLFKVYVAPSESGKELLLEWIRQDAEYSKWCLRQDRKHIAENLLEAIVNWWRGGREGKRITRELVGTVEKMVRKICEDAFERDSDSWVNHCLGHLEANTFPTDTLNLTDEMYFHRDHSEEVIEYSITVLDYVRDNPRIVVSGGRTDEIRRMGIESFPSMRL
jgi:hypothetical protein